MMRLILPKVTVRALWDRLSDWFDDHPVHFLIGVTVGAIGGILLLAALLSGCPQTRYPGYFLTLTDYKLDKAKWERTSKGIRVHGPGSLHAEIDRRTDELERCFRERGLAKSIQRNWFAVYVPSDWYVSKCRTGEQLVPSRIDYRLCEQKGIKVPLSCRGVARPTEACPCPCNIRAGLQNGPKFPVLITAPNLKLYKNELTRLVLGPKYNAPWKHEKVRPCLR